MSIDTEMPQRKSEAPHVEERQLERWPRLLAVSASESSWPGRECYPRAHSRCSGVLSVTDEFALFLFSL